METDLLKKLDPFFHQYKPLYYKKGQIILRPEDKVDGIYFIEKGYVRFYSLSEDGRELTYLIYKPGYLFPIIYTFLGETTKYYFDALTPLILRRAPRAAFTNLVVDNSSALFSIGQEIVIRFEEMLNRMQYSAFGTAYQAVAHLLLNLGEQFGTTKGQSMEINLPITHRDIASMAGLTRETVSLAMKQLEENKFIIYRRNHIAIKNADKFRKEINLY